MNRIKLLFISLLLTFHGFSQKNFFVYLQTENRQPFSVRLNGKLYSSTEMGYVVIPKLFSGSYSLTVDFPKKIFDTQQFDINLLEQDLGFLLINQESKNWILQNLQTKEMILAANKIASDGKVMNVESDDFSSTLSQITNTPLRRVEEKKSVELDEKETTKANEEEVSEVGLNEKAEKKSVVSLIFSSLDSTGRSLIYSVPRKKGGADTVVIFIPYDEKEVSDTRTEVIGGAKAATFVQSQPKEIGTSQVNEKSIDGSVVSTDMKDLNETQTDIRTDELKEKKSVEAGASGCMKVADEKDFLQLRKKMATQETEKAMINQAEKAFKQRCYSSQQIRNLAALFLQESNRLQFLLSSRGYLVDVENFPGLETLLTEQVNILLFKEAIK